LILRSGKCSAVDFVEICNVYMGKTIIKAAKRIFISVKICRSYSDLNFGVTFLEHSVLVTNRKSHTGFRLIPTSMTSMTLNDLEWRNNAYFAFFSPNSLLCWQTTSQWLKIDL